jgi:putative protease
MARTRPEVLAPAGDRAALEAAVRAGADAVYFGLQAWSARARATNFDAAALQETMGFLHRHAVKGYVTLNTLVFDSELPLLVQALDACAAAAVDAVIVQDLGVARLVRALCPALPLHASTQMTCTDAAAVELAASLGARRVILARELSLDDIAAIRAATDVELEVFVHGALCISYSGQCMTSEAIGGRSANRGACAQACRLPYDLLVDGQPRDLGERAYLLSPEDLEASALVPRLVELGVSSIKIEGRLKGPDYVAATTRLYKEAVAAALGEAAPPDEELRRTALQTYTRGSGPGFLAGVDHQRLVDGRTCEHHGLPVGVLRGVRRWKGAAHLVVALDADVARGDGLVLEGGREGAGELGGRVWRIGVGGRPAESAPAGSEAWLWLGPDVRIDGAQAGRRLFRTSDPAVERRVRGWLAQPATAPLDLHVTGALGEPARFTAQVEGGATAVVSGDVPLHPAGSDGALEEAVLRAQLGRLGGTPFHLRALTVDLPPDAGVPVSSLNRARRALVDALAAAVPPPWPRVAVPLEAVLASATPPALPPPPAGLFVVCRNRGQAEAALAAGADGVYLDFLELTGTGDAFRALQAAGAPWIGLAPPRVRKPGEEKIDRFLRALGPAALLVRGLGALHELATSGAPRPLAVGDFSLNVTNRLAAAEVLARGCHAFTPAFDLDGGQVRALLDGAFAPFAEVVLHHPMPLFHMEHCLIAATLSQGSDHRTCGRPCDRHQVSLRDRAGMDHPVEADVGCRNTVFHAAAQSAAELAPALQRKGVRRFRIELVREQPADVRRIVASYRALLAGSRSAAEVWRELRAGGGVGGGYGVSAGGGPGVVRGSLRVVG